MTDQSQPTPEVTEAEYIMESDRAQHTVQRYVCAKCWNHLVQFFVKGSRKVRVTCPLCGDGQGFVTKSYAERQQAESAAKAADAKAALRQAVPWMKSTKTAEQLAKELGF